MGTCFDTKALVGKALSVVLPGVLIGCSSLPLSSGVAFAQSTEVTGDSADSARSGTQSDMDSQLMFELMIAELAGRRGQLEVALAGYLRASENTDDPRVSERATRLAMFGRQWSEAEAVARRWIALDPDNAEAPQILGQSLLRQDKPEQAAQLYETLLEDADNPRQLLRDIQFELQRNDNPAIAVSVMSSLVERFGDQSEAHLGLARAQVTNNQSDEALNTTAEALRLAPNDTEALLLRAQILSGTGKPDEAISLLQEALNATPGNTDLRLGYAQLLVDAGRFEQVDAELAYIYDESSDDADTLLTISLLALESRRLEQARGYLAALQANGAYPDQANFYLARISDEQKEFAQAIAFYDAVGQGDLQFSAQIRAAELTALIGDLEQGRIRLREIAAGVSNPAIQPRLVTAESRMLQNANRAGEAVVVLTEGLQRFPDDQDLLYARALAADAAGDDAKMVSDLTRLISMDENNAHALNALGYYYADENIQLEEAEQLLIKANELLPDDPAIMDSLGWLRFRQGQYDEAIDLLRGAYQRFADPEIAAHLGEALLLSGAQGEARELIDEALQANPDDERLLAVRKSLPQ